MEDNNIKLPDHELAKAFEMVMPYFPILFGEKTMSTITDGTRALRTHNIEEVLNIDYPEGSPLQPGDPNETAMKTGEVQSLFYPKEVFGYPVVSVAIPIKKRDRETNIYYLLNCG